MTKTFTITKKVAGIRSIGMAVVKAAVGMTRGLKPFNCSRFARLEAEKRFGIKYQPADAWDRKYVDRVIPLEGKTLDDKFNDGTLTSGMMIGLFNPNSLFLNGEDRTGKPRKYTHVALCVGRNQYTHQYGSKVRVDTEQDLKELNLSPVEILASS